MSNYNIVLVSDKKGNMTSNDANPVVVADAVVTLLNLADRFEKIYEYLSGDYNNDTDIFIMLADVEEILDELNIQLIEEVHKNLGMMLIYSKNPRWINSAMDDIVGDINKTDISGESVLDVLSDIVDDGDVINRTTVDFLKASIYNFISAAYQEVFYSYNLNQFFDGSKDIEITRGFNEASVRLSKSPEDIAILVHEKMQTFIFVSNEVDRDEEVSKKIRSQIPSDLTADFESIIEYITAEQVDNILNGKIRINTDVSCRKFIDSIENEFCGGDGDN